MKKSKNKNEEHYVLNKGLLIASISFVVLIVVCLIVCLMLTGCNSSNKKCDGGTCTLTFIKFYLDFFKVIL